MFDKKSWLVETVSSSQQIYFISSDNSFSIENIQIGFTSIKIVSQIAGQE